MKPPRDRTVLVVLFVVAALLWAFAGIAEEVFENETDSFDAAIVQAVRSPSDPALVRGPEFLTEVARDFTALGGVVVLTGLVISICGFLLLSGKRRAVAAILVTTIGGALLSTGFKAVFDRPRPALVPHLSIVMTSSFPSGHATLSAVVYLTLAAMSATLLERRSLKVYVLVLAVILTLAVGVSRVAVGVHYPTDVVAGWALGSAWALLAWAVMRQLQRAGRVEQASPA